MNEDSRNTKVYPVELKFWATDLPRGDGLIEGDLMVNGAVVCHGLWEFDDLYRLDPSDSWGEFWVPVRLQGTNDQCTACGGLHRNPVTGFCEQPVEARATLDSGDDFDGPTGHTCSDCEGVQDFCHICGISHKDPEGIRCVL